MHQKPWAPSPRPQPPRPANFSAPVCRLMILSVTPGQPCWAPVDPQAPSAQPLPHLHILCHQLVQAPDADAAAHLVWVREMGGQGRGVQQMQRHQQAWRIHHIDCSLILEHTKHSTRSACAPSTSPPMQQLTPHSLGTHPALTPASPGTQHAAPPAPPQQTSPRRWCGRPPCSPRR